MVLYGFKLQTPTAACSVTAACVFSTLKNSTIIIPSFDQNKKKQKKIFFSFKRRWKLFLQTLSVHRWCVMIEVIYDCVGVRSGLLALWLEVLALSLPPSHFTLNASWGAEKTGNNPSNNPTPPRSSAKWQYSNVTYWISQIVNK